MKDAILHLLPETILELLKRVKKYFRNRKLASQKNNQQFLTKEELIMQIKNCGIVTGDHLLVHCALSKIGYINGGALTLLLDQKEHYLCHLFPRKEEIKIIC